MYRSVDYINQLKALRCVIINPKFRLESKYYNMLFPVTINGTISFEISLCGLRKCFAGEPWYKNTLGTFNLKQTFSEQ